MSPKQSKESVVNPTPAPQNEDEAALPEDKTMMNAPACDPASAASPAEASHSEGHAAQSFPLLFERVEAEARALPESELRAVDTDVYVVASGTMQRHAKLLQLRPSFEHHNFSLWAMDNLADYALVACDAYTAHRPTLERVAPETTALLEASVPMLERCQEEAALLIGRGKIAPEELGNVSARKSFRNNAERLMRYARVLEREHAYLVACKSTLTLEDIAQYMDVARALSDIVGERATQASAQTSAQAKSKRVSDDMMTRTFTLLDKAMDEVRAGLTYLLRETPEKIDAYLPRKPKKPAASKAKKSTPVEVKAPAKPSNGEAPARGTSPGNAPSPMRDEVRAAG